MSKKVVLCWVMLFLLLLSSVAADEDSNGSMEGLLTKILLWAVALTFMFILASAIISVDVVRKMKVSLMGAVSTYNLAGIIIVAAIELNVVLFESGFLDVDESTFIIWNHLFFYLGMLAFFVALTKLASAAKAGKISGFEVKDKALIAIILTVTFVLFFAEKPLNPWLASWFNGSFWETVGIQHLLAFAAAGSVAVRLVKIRHATNFGKLFTVTLSSFLIFLILMASIHFLELMAETLELVPFPGYSIELIEQLLWIAAAAVLLYGLVRLRQTLNK